MTYERLKQFLILSICSVLLLGLIADEARAESCVKAIVNPNNGEVAKFAYGKPVSGKCELDRSDSPSIDPDVDNSASGSGLLGKPEKSFSEWVTDDIKRGRNDDEFCTNVVEKLGDYQCEDNGRYLSGTPKTDYVNECDQSWNDRKNSVLEDLKRKALRESQYYGNGTLCDYGFFKGTGRRAGNYYAYATGESVSGRCAHTSSDYTSLTSNQFVSILAKTDDSCISVIERIHYVSNDDLAKKFNDLDMSDFDKMLSSPAFDQYMDELEKIGIHWTGKLQTEKKKVEEKTDYHPDGTQSLTELYESKEYSYDGQTNSNNNKLYPTQEKTHSTTVVDGKTTSSGTSTRPGKGAGGNSSGGSGEGEGDGPLDAKVDGSQIGLGESPEIPELYQQKYKNTDWAEIVEDGLQDNPMLDNLKGIGSQYTTGVCPSFEQEFFGELIVIDIPCELLDMIRAFFLTISTISAFWIIFRRA